MSERIERCETCRFYERFERQTISGTDVRDHGDYTGQCKRYPPTLDHAFRFYSAKDADEQLDEAPTDDLLAQLESYHCRFPATISSDWCGEWQPSNQQAISQLSDLQLARLWEMQKRYKGWGVEAVAANISRVRNAIASGVDGEENICRVFKCKQNTKRWRAIAEIRARLLGEYQPIPPAAATTVEAD